MLYLEQLVHFRLLIRHDVVNGILFGILMLMLK